MKEHQVVITGLGAVTPVGIGVKSFCEGLEAGRNGIARVTHFDPAEFRSKLAAEVKSFQPEEWIDKKAARRMDRFAQFGVAASAMAFDDAGLNSFSFDKNRAGVIIGSGIGGSQTIEDGYAALQENGPDGLNPFFVSKLLINMAACMVSIKHGLKGPLSAPSVACSSGSNAIGDAFRILQRGDADIMLAGSSEACITRLAYGCFCATRSMTPNDNASNASRPFDKNRDGFVMGEGAGIAVLENLEHALERGARIYAEIAGYGNTADAYHFTAPEPNSDGMIRVMQAALRDAGLDAENVEYINAHGTSTVLNDKCESAAIEKVFGEHAKSLKVSSIKSMIGHLMAAAGSVEFVATVMSVFTGIIPPTINFEEADPDCSLDYVTNGAESMDINAAMSNSFGFGGGNACLVIKKYGDRNGRS
ncbi:MAG: beta-ketoacyl-ACP synthase II [Candidatus Eisenbacteria bacterium]|uniref:3-oxoacyl-[acyl-carrier-protein] synthase 2 n=1 Tax=Eiseniibacteriota bacterium TaxID=2212470 RepID=A0A948RZ69_UNCEI|nr:beta-ketoacyl-ACP synthase II [Candidatus Eisenbacteria bacterium]MBU1947925.1 beta-ketoacyl-ACP synthase II [Candidatus Eisenbacteria bacterium]MBU2692338.1 beta-ketoacyl-ACP synthase II [Candidatus Eisenbacteria bacterium]